MDENKGCSAECGNRICEICIRTAIIKTAIISAIIAAAVFAGCQFWLITPASNNMIGVAYLDTIIFDSVAGKKASVDLHEYVKNYAVNARKEQEDLDKEKALIEGRKNTISEAKYREQLAAFNDKQSKLIQKFKKYQEIAEKSRTNTINEIGAKATKIIKKEKVSHGFEYILNGNALIGHDSDIDKKDITDLVIKVLNDELKSIDIKFDESILEGNN